MPRYVISILIIALGVVSWPGAVFAVQDDAAAMNIRARSNTPLAIRGSVMLIPIVRDDDSIAWPQRMSATYVDLELEAPGQVVWVCPAYSLQARLWTDDPRGRVIRSVSPDRVDELPEGSVAYIAIPTPLEGRGSVVIGDMQLRPTWLDPVDWRGVDEDDAPAPSILQRRGQSGDDARPDVTSGFEFWRAVLMSRVRGTTGPTLSALDPPTRAMAVHVTDLWLSGLARLQAIDEPLYDGLVAALTRTCRDGERELGAWVADPAKTDALLASLLDVGQDDERLVAQVQVWLDAVEPLLVVPLTRYDDVVEVAVFNRGAETRTVMAFWQGIDDGADPAPVDVGAGDVVRLSIERPVDDGPIRLGPTRSNRTETPLLELLFDNDTSVRVAPASRTLSAMPPGIMASGMHPALTLADIETGVQRTTAASGVTHMHVRRRAGRWEVFFDCRRPDRNASSSIPTTLTSIADVRGHEAVSLRIQREDGEAITLVIPEEGWWRLSDETAKSALQIHRRSFGDRWYCRVVLPPEWLTFDAEGLWLHLGVVRSHGDTRSIESLPERTLPWDADPGTMKVDLSGWTDTPSG